MWPFLLVGLLGVGYYYYTRQGATCTPCTPKPGISPTGAKLPPGSYVIPAAAMVQSTTNPGIFNITVPPIAVQPQPIVVNGQTLKWPPAGQYQLPNSFVSPGPTTQTRIVTIPPVGY